MDFDQMMDAWKAQDDRPLYGVNRDLLQLVLRHEQAGMRRTLRLEKWVTYVVGAGMGAFAAFWLWVAIYRGESTFNTVAAGVSTGAFVLWIVAMWLSLRRQARRERSFGNTLRGEIGRSLSLVDYQLSRGGRLGAALLWTAPVMVGALLIYWLAAEINDNTDFWFDVWMIFFVVASTVWSTYATSRKTKQKLEPRRQRLSELLQALDASE